MLCSYPVSTYPVRSYVPTVDDILNSSYSKTWLSFCTSIDNMMDVISETSEAGSKKSFSGGSESSFTIAPLGFEDSASNIFPDVPVVLSEALLSCAFKWVSLLRATLLLSRKRFPPSPSRVTDIVLGGLSLMYLIFKASHSFISLTHINAFFNNFLSRNLFATGIYLKSLSEIHSGFNFIFNAESEKVLNRILLINFRAFSNDIIHSDPKADSSLFFLLDLALSDDRFGHSYYNFRTLRSYNSDKLSDSILNKVNSKKLACCNTLLIPQSVDGEIFNPDKPYGAVISDSQVYFNIFKKVDVKGALVDQDFYYIILLLAHLNLMISGSCKFGSKEFLSEKDISYEEYFYNSLKLCETDTLFLLFYFVNIRRYPGKRKQFMPVIEGMHGLGKSILTNLINSVVGIDYVVQITEKNLDSDFNGVIDNKLVCIFDEMYCPKKHIEYLKRLITSGRVEINKKGIESEVKTHIAFCIGYKNKNSQIAVADTERRFYFIETFLTSEEAKAKYITPEYITTLLDAFNNHGESYCKVFDTIELPGWYQNMLEAPKTVLKDKYVRNYESDLKIKLADKMELAENGESDDCFFLADGELVVVIEDLRAGLISDVKIPERSYSGKKLNSILRDLSFHPIRYVHRDGEKTTSVASYVRCESTDHVKLLKAGTEKYDTLIKLIKLRRKLSA